MSGTSAAQGAPPGAILETVVYAADLDAAERFYGGVLGLARTWREGGRHVFYRCGAGMLLVFNPEATRTPPEGALAIPPHGAAGPGHVCFAAPGPELAAWRARLEAAGIAIESVVDWPQGGRSVYCRDPAGNSVEFAEPRIWGFA